MRHYAEFWQIRLHVNVHIHILTLQYINDLMYNVHICTCEMIKNMEAILYS